MRGQNRKLSRETLNSLSRTAVPKYANQPDSQAAPIRRVKGLRERNGSWHYRIKWRGKEISGDTELAATEANIDAAKAKRQAALNDLRYPKDKQGPKRVEILVPDAVDRFVEWYKSEHEDKPNTWKWARGVLASFKWYFPNDLISDLHPGLIEDFKEDRRRNKHNSVGATLKAANLLFKYGRKQGWLDSNPLEDVDIPPQKRVSKWHILSPEEEMRYFAEARKRSIDLADVHTIMIQQGCRPTEIFTLERSSVDLNEGKFTVTEVFVSDERGKTCKSLASRRTLKMTPDTYAILSGRMNSDEPRWLFPSNRKAGAPLLTLQKAHEYVVKKTGIVCKIYDHRHTFATRAARAGCNIWDLARLIGHSDISVLNKYVHPSQEDMDSAMLALAAGMAPKFAEMLVSFEAGSQWQKVDREVDGGPLSRQNRAKITVISPNNRRRAG